MALNAPSRIKQTIVAYMADFPQASLFQHPEWLDLLAGPRHWEQVVSPGRDGSPEAVWAVTYRPGSGRKIIQKPPLTPWLGPVFRSPPIHEGKRLSYFKQHLAHLQSQLPSIWMSRQTLPPEFLQPQPFAWLGYELHERFTYRLDLKQPLPVLWGQLKPALRGRIRKGEESVAIVEGWGHKKSVYPAFNATLANKRAGQALGEDVFFKMLQLLEKLGKGRLLTAIDKQGQAKAQVLLVVENGTALALVIVSAGGQPQDSYTMPCLLWSAVQLAAREGLSCFDFEGSMLPGVARFFAAFNATPTPYLELRRYRNRLVKAGFALLGR